MSQLRAPEARPERREGGRHGRPGARSHAATARPRAAQPSPEARIRPQLLRTAVLPAVAAVLSGAAAVIFTVRSTGARPSSELWIGLGGAGALALAAVLAAYLAANRVATTVFGRCLALRRASVHGQAELQRVVEQLRNGESVPARRPAQPVVPGSDAFELLGQELSRQQEVAVAAIVQASRLSDHTGEDQKVEVFVNLARRLQSLVHREIQLLDELEHEVEDPDLLKGLFHVDHLATRIRRHAENLAVLGGAVSRRQWSNPVTMTEVLRSAIAEVEQYPRVKLVPPIDGTLRGHAVADVIHLLAELVENATVFSAPHTQVLLRAQQVTAGLALEVEDRGLGMPGNEQRRMNALLADPDQVNVAHLLQDGRIGLFVVASLARRHGIAVQLQSNIYGGTQAVLVLPQSLLGLDGDVPAGGDAAPVPPPGPVHRPPAEDATGVHRRPNPDRGLGPGPDRGPAPSPQPSTNRQPYVPSQPLHLHQPAQQTGHQGEAPPLPLRAERLDRSAPAEAGRGNRGTDDAPEALHPEALHPEALHPEPGVVRGTLGRPQLPRRANQEHLVPQLREAPAPRSDDEQALHDPGLMAAFRRGIELAEARAESGADTAQAAGTSLGTASAPQARQPRAPLEPLPVRGLTATAAPHTQAPAPDTNVGGTTDPLESNTSKE
ncbi:MULTISPECIES: sensor histidine kinase [unclassified Streptomyces]|uniref:sensor histidine kinase n=1 Tax=unclassified Streptomyces TaxID=2593676 RepID=UPI002259F384|nr:MULTISPECIES: ATP-binding protein [unclassified Streptomyces]MCX4790819.1 ATP-binding protein [Streptomyces sp. NBC_01221]WSJ34885.1 ATP-binding protein [Streptomyces sp. NBC_01321]WSP59080.1 ATP-binding protein [Streptomyces sp. NBC_01241]WSP61329.1 ATP-binding protein [Streptomyces sp. NBC_01240]